MSKSGKYLAEAVGTFVLVFVGTGAASADALSGRLGPVGIAAAFGLSVLALVYTLGHISGAHFNPAVSVGFWAAGRLPGREVPAYAASQLSGAVLAAALVRFVFGTPSAGLTLPAGGVLPAFAMEFVLTAFLMLVIMGVATDERAQGAAAGTAIGATVAAAALAGGQVSGASMNPARSFGPALAAGSYAGQWLYWAGPVLGAVAGARLYALLRCPSDGPGGASGCC